MKQLIKSAFNSFGYEINRAKKNENRFTIGKINFDVDSCSVGQTPQGELTGEAAIRLIRERGLRNLRILDVCCGVGIIGLTIFSRLNDEGIVDGAGFVDINIFNLNSLERTLKLNGMGKLIGSKIDFWLSNSLNAVPENEKFDIIVSNPPHFFSEAHSAEALSPGKLGTYDAEWSFHKSFYSQCHKYLTERGEVWFLENGDAIDAKGLLPMIEANPALEYMGQQTEPLDPVFFWMFTKKV